MFFGGTGLTYKDTPMVTTGRLVGEMTTSASLTQTRAPSSSYQQPVQLPHWGNEETSDLIAIRGEVEREDGTCSKGGVGKNKKTVWEEVSWRMKERGHSRTPEQCKCKWKNLLHRYKGRETSSHESGQPWPFFEELHSLFAERSKSMHRALVESEANSSQSSRKRKSNRLESEFLEGNCEADDGSVEKPHRSHTEKGTTMKACSAGGEIAHLHQLLKKVLQQQRRMDAELMERMERRAYERDVFEQEWRQSMERLQRERLVVEMEWREREEGRRMREESRAERRDALLTSLLNQFIHES